MTDSTVFDRLSMAGDVRPLSRRTSGYLQVLLSEFTLSRQENGCRIEITIPDDPLTIINNLGKRDIESECQKTAEPGCDELTRQLEGVWKDPNVLSCRFDCSNWPMRFANGGVLPVVQIDGEEYYLLFYRDIFPIGWNIANGASDTVDEWVEPTRIIQREFGEEVLIFDPDKKLLYVYNPPGDARPVGFHEEAIEAWSTRISGLDEFKTEPIPLKWIEGPDSADVRFGARHHVSTGAFLSVTPPDHGIEVDRIAQIRLGSNVRFLAGEMNDGKLLNQLVGFFSVNKIEEAYSGHDFRPDFFCFNGQRFEADQLDDVLPRSLQEIRSTGQRRDDQISFYEDADVKFDFCPITRAVIGRHIEWKTNSQTQSPEATPQVRITDESKPYDIFISHRSTRVDHARALHDFLVSRGFSVFFSDETLAAIGESDYMRAINHALDQANCLILLALDPSDLESGWVDFEWKAFHNEIVSGRKNGQIFTLLHNVSISEVPIMLRPRQSVPYSLGSPLDSFENLHRYLSTPQGES